MVYRLGALSSDLIGLVWGWCWSGDLIGLVLGDVVGRVILIGLVLGQCWWEDLIGLV